MWLGNIWGKGPSPSGTLCASPGLSFPYDTTRDLFSACTYEWSSAGCHPPKMPTP